MSATLHPAANPISERTRPSWPGLPMLGLALLALLWCGQLIYRLANDHVLIGNVWPQFLVILAVPWAFAGLYMLSPKSAAILSLFGQYVGTDRSEGLRWANPFFMKRIISLRARNLNIAPLKVNDQRGNPIEIGAVVVWSVRDTAQAVYEVDDYERYAQVQAEAALRHLAALYPYDEGEQHGDTVITLRGAQDEVSDALRTELEARLARAGVNVLDAKLSHLAYAPEIAQVMLRRQQAEAIISARSKIVQGAVGMVEAALKGLSDREIVVLDDERKAAMISNLLVVLCADREAQPVINAGTLYN